MTPGRLLNMALTRPGIRSFMAGPAPRYGTWVISMPAMRLNSSPLRCGEAPMPVEAKVTLPRLALASSMNSRTERAGDEFDTSIAFEITVSSDTGARSVNGL